MNEEFDAQAARMLAIMGGALDQQIRNSEYLRDRGMSTFNPEAYALLLRAREIRDAR